MMPSCTTHKRLTNLVLETTELPQEIKNAVLEYVCEPDEVEKRDYFYAEVISYAGKYARKLKPRYGVVHHHASPELAAVTRYYYALSIQYILSNKTKRPTTNPRTDLRKCLKAPTASIARRPFLNCTRPIET
jgi:hypothetical protein